LNLIERVKRGGDRQREHGKTLHTYKAKQTFETNYEAYYFKTIDPYLI
jgi:hypothetical protein